MIFDITGAGISHRSVCQDEASAIRGVEDKPIPGIMKTTSILCYHILASHPGARLLAHNIVFRNAVKGNYGMITKIELRLPSIRPFPTLVDTCGLGFSESHPYQFELCKASFVEGEYAMALAFVGGRGIGGKTPKHFCY